MATIVVAEEEEAAVVVAAELDGQEREMVAEGPSLPCGDVAAVAGASSC